MLHLLSSMLVTSALALLIVHFLPTIVACVRGHQNALAIFIVNLLFGWTIIGWGIALVWACTEVRRYPIIYR